VFNGIDVFSGTNVKDWNKIKASGIQAVYIKADGKTYVNPLLDQHYKGAKAVGMLVGFYHFAETNTVQDEYNHFKNTIKNYQQDLRPCLDYEVKTPCFAFIKLFMAQDENLIFYSDHAISDLCDVSNSRTWIAEPGTSPINTKSYAGIQHNFYGRVDGLSGDADLDLFSDLVLNKKVTLNNIVGSVKDMVINIGENSPRVKILQGILNVILGAKLDCDGKFGTKSSKAVAEYQKRVGLVVSGGIGEVDIIKLFADLKANWFKL